MNTSWNDEEDEALMGLPWVCRVLYLQGLRRYMDYGTGIVGGPARRISWQMLREVLYVEPHQGFEGGGTPSRGKVNRAMEWLIKAGLVADIGDKQRGGNIVFRLLLADTDESVSNKPGQNPDRVETPKPGQNQNSETDREYSSLDEVETKTRTPKKTHPENKPGHPPVTGKYNTGSTNVLVEFATASLDECGQPTLPVRHIFEYWKAATNHPRAKLDDKRRRAIAGRLKDGYSIADLKRAIDGCIASPWHQGQNGNRRVYDDIELICRNASKVDGFMSVGSGKDTERQKLDEWLNGEMTIEGEFTHVS